jgi:hypothetical protein
MSNRAPGRFAVILQWSMSVRCIAFFIGFTVATLAQTPGKDTTAAIPLSIRLDLTLIDLPFNTENHGQWPSMAQSRTVAAALNETGCYGIAAVAGRVHNPVARVAAATGLEIVLLFGSTYLPFGNTWLHEEYHRAVLSNQGIGSYDGMYSFDYDINTVSVTNVADDALSRLKAQHPEDLVRSHAAGYEGQVDLADRLLEDGFYNKVPLVEFPALYALLSNTGYMYYSTTKYADDEIIAFNERETSPDERDFTGWDYTAWTYDLHRPDELYAARGTHPSGNGINRYVRWGDLRPDEQKYLRLQTVLSLINFLRPQLYAPDPWRATLHGERIDCTGGLQHDLTPFGYEIGLRLAAAGRTSGMSAAINFFHNERLVLPEIDVRLLDVPVSVSKADLTWSPRLVLWLQPKGQRFQSAEVLPGMLTSQKLGIMINRFFGVFTEVECKTTGWVSGVESIEPAINLRLGSILRF